MNAVSGSSFTLIKFLYYFDIDSIILQVNLSYEENNQVDILSKKLVNIISFLYKIFQKFIKKA